MSFVLLATNKSTRQMVKHGARWKIKTSATLLLIILFRARMSKYCWEIPLKTSNLNLMLVLQERNWGQRTMRIYGGDDIHWWEDRRVYHVKLFLIRANVSISEWVTTTKGCDHKPFEYKFTFIIWGPRKYKQVFVVILGVSENLLVSHPSSPSSFKASSFQHIDALKPTICQQTTGILRPDGS